MCENVSDEAITGALATIATFLKVPEDQLALCFPVWEDGMRGLVIVYDPTEGTHKEKIGRFVAGLSKEYDGGE